MQCGPNDIFCFVLKWLIEHEAVSSEGAEVISSVLAGTHPVVNALALWLHENASKLFAAASFSFAVWKWWRYREAVLHKRLEEYIKESDLRLPPSREQVVEIISRPDRRAKLRQPAFAIELQRVLQRNNWEPALHSGRAYEAMSRSLEGVAKRVDKRIETAQKALSSLNQQRAAADTILAALSAGRALRARKLADAEVHDRAALEKYRQVLTIQGHRDDLVALEGVAFHTLRTGNLSQALTSYESLEERAEDITEPKRRAILVARARRYQAMLLQARAPGGALGGFQLCTDALEGLEEFVPTLQNWDLIELAELHYVTAYIAHRLSFVIVEPQRLTDARTFYERLRASLPNRHFIMSAAQKRLDTACREGLKRVTDAQKQGPDKRYDLAWLFQPSPPPSSGSDQTQKPTKSVS